LGELRDAAQTLTEAHGILAALDRAGTLPASSRASLASLGNEVASINAKLAGLQKAAQ
jgi:hypothetical protein